MASRRPSTDASASSQHPHLVRSPYHAAPLPRLHEPPSHDPPSQNPALRRFPSSLIARGQGPSASHTAKSNQPPHPSFPVSPRSTTSWQTGSVGSPETVTSSFRSSSAGSPDLRRHNSFDHPPSPRLAQAQTGHSHSMSLGHTEQQSVPVGGPARRPSHDFPQKVKHGLKKIFKREKVDEASVERVESKHWSDDY